MGGLLAKYSAPLQSNAGAVQTGATISVFLNGSTNGGTQLGTLTPIPVYPGAALINPMTNPFVETSGTVTFYMPFPQRVDLGVQVPGAAQVFFPDIDVITAAIVPTVVTATYTMALTDQLILASAASGNVSLQLPVSYAGLIYRFKRTDTAAGNAVTIIPAGAQQIDGSASLAVPTLGHAALLGDGSNWWVI